MNFIFSVVLLLCSCAVVNSQAGGNCDIDYPDIWNKKEIIQVVDNNAVGETWTFNAKHIKSISIENPKYVDVEFTGTSLKFKLRPEFSNYVEQETSSRNENKLIFECDDGIKHTDIKFILDVKDTFNHPPEFLDTPYNFKLAMPITTGQVISAVTIKAKDIDLRNKKLKFEVIEDYADSFEFTDSVKAIKEYTTQLKTRKSLNMKKSFEIKIKVTDDHSVEPKSSTETIFIEIDEENSVIPDPVFEKPLYQEKYATNVIITTSLGDNVYKLKDSKLTGENSDCFEVEELPNSIVVKAIKDLPEDIADDKSYLVLILETKYDGAESSGKTVILLDFPTKPVATTTIEPITACPTFPPTTTEAAITCPPCTTEPPTTTVCPTAPPCECTTQPSTACPTLPPATTETAVTCPPCTTEPSTACPTLPPTTTETAVTCPPCTTEPSTACPTLPPTTTETAVTCPPCTTGPTTTSTASDGTTICPPVTTCPTSPPCDCTTPIWTTVSTCTPCDCGITTCEPTITTTTETPEDHVYYENAKYKFEKTSDYVGVLEEIIAKSTISEKLEYSIKDTSNDDAVKPNLLYKPDGKLTIISKIDPGLYTVTLQVKGVTSKTVDSTKVTLSINSVSQCNGKPCFPNSLIVKELDEEKEAIVFPELKDHSFTITGDNLNNWFKIKDGGLWINKINREDELISSMYMSQIKTMIQVTSNVKSTPAKTSSLAILSSWKDSGNSELLGPCVYTSSIEYNPTRMTVAVIVKDINDNDPEFKEDSPFIIGYPSQKLAKFIAPPYLVKLTATDKDIGYNALIKYSTKSSKFTVDPYTGIVYPGKNTFEDDEDVDFQISATDQDGHGNTAKLDVKVKILKESYLSTVVVKNVLYADLDAFVSKISTDTGKIVRYISSTGMFETKGDNSEKKMNDEKIPVLKIVMYAIDKDGKPMQSKEFRKLVEDKVSEIETEQYKPPIGSSNDGDDDDNHSGWIAAVSTLSVLLALIIIGVLVGYIFLIRPKMMSSTTPNYIKHETRDSVHHAPIEEKLESSIAMRRATGFPPNFNMDDLDTAEVEHEKEISDAEADEGINQSDSSSNPETTVRRKSIVKFDNNVTEIEIEEF